MSVPSDLKILIPTLLRHRRYLITLPQKSTMLPILTSVVIASIFGITTSKNTLLDLQKILDDIAENKLENRDLDIYKLFSKTPNHHRHKNHKISPNLMNVQTMNLYMKPNRHNLDQFLRMETNKTCQGPGRCGCTGTRCRDTRNGPDDEASNTIDDIVDEVNRQLDRDTTTSSDTDTDEIDNYLRVNDRNSDYDDREEDLNDIDVIVLNAVEDQLENSNELPRNFIYLDKDESIEGKRLESYILGRNNPQTTDTSAPTPDEFVNHYQTVKNDVIKQLLNYLQNNTPIPLKHLHDQQKQLLKELKMNYKLGLVNTDNLIPEIVEIVFGKKSGTRIQPHIENNDNIYIPKWHYNSLLQFKKDLRSKRLLPLTTQQRERILNKKTNTIPKLAWRRSLDNGQYGVPFNLEVHGLGQLNP